MRPNFEEQAKLAVEQDAWVIDGGYSRITQVVWPRADLVVWLDYTFPTVFMQLLSRTVRRCWNKENLFGGNRESWRIQFLSKESLFLWLFKTYRRRKQTLSGLAQKHPDVSLLRHISRERTSTWLDNLSRQTNG
jgi:adenylate kinase family enzyme